MILYVNGDSHSAGTDASADWKEWEDLAYGKKLANSLNFDYVCDAQAGCSNESIINRTTEYIKTNTPDFVIIGWSTFERQEWTYRNRKYQITSSGFDKLPKGLHEKYKEFVINSQLPETQWRVEKDNHNKIYNLHLELKQKNIKHLFFNCYSWFFYHTAQNWTKTDWGNNYIEPYNKNSTYYFWLESQGFKPRRKKYYHYGADAHQAWAEFLLPKVQSLLTQNG